MAMPPPLHAEGEPPMERLGDLLRRRREQRGDDLQQIADILCIRKGFLVALENSDYDELPADAYVIGFLRSYATYLGFDGREAIDHYRHEMAGRRRKTMLVVPTPISEGRTPSAPIMIGAAVMALLIYGAWYGFSDPGRAIVTAAPALPPVPVAAPAAPANAISGTIGASVVTPAIGPPSTSVTPPLSAAAPTILGTNATNMTNTNAAPSSHLLIRAEKESWVLVTDAKGNTVFDHVMKPGETYAVPDQPGLKLTTGNGNAITLALDGADLPKLSRDSRVLHDIPLDTGKLKAPATGAPE
jgi:cytoskeletal protein RodZ